ncbi:hypothetical protein FRC00_004385, partial [Tulasnella sp. 408]
GCMSYGSPEWQGWVLGEEEGLKHIKTAYDLGINAFDTANWYSNGLSEVILGKAIKKYNLPRDEIVVMTKLYATVSRDLSEHSLWGQSINELGKKRYSNQQGLSRKHIFESVKHSLERLQLDYIDLLQCHRFDYDTPIEETMQALNDVVKAGYVRYIGMSSCYAWQYLGVGMIPWSPLAAGFLTRSYKEQTLRGKTDSLAVKSNPEQDTFLAEINEAVSEIAQKRGVSMAQVAIAWSLSKPFISAPIVGTTSLEKLKDLIAGVSLKLTDEEIKTIDEPYRPRAIAGMD